MQRITIELIDNQALTLIRQLEKVQWIRIVKPKTGNAEKPVLKLGGTIAPDVAKDMEEQLKSIRESWERDFS